MPKTSAMKLVAWFLLSLLVGCGAAPQRAPTTPGVACSAPVDQPRILYAGPYYGVENSVPASAFGQDMACADEIKARIAPDGYVAVFGSSRIGESNDACGPAGTACDAEVKNANDALYALVREFAAKWTSRYGQRYPILSGAGPGLMEAAHRGAAEARGPSVGYTTYYDRAGPGANADKPMAGDPSKALSAYVTHGVIFSSIVTREAAMIKHSAALVIAPGGTGTEWEIFQIVETLKSRQLRPVPVYLLGDRRAHWTSLTNRLDDMVRRKVIRADEIAFIRYAATPELLVEALARDLKLP